MSLLRLYLIFVNIGAILLGGGYVILPILQHEFIDKRHIISEDDLLNFYALSQSLPGIVAANISMFIGYKFKGKLGAIVALLGIITFPIITIILLASILENLVSNKYIQAVLWGIGVAVIALIILTVREMFQKTEKNVFFYLILVLTLLSLLIFELSPIKAIIIFSIIGVGIKFIKRRFSK